MTQSRRWGPAPSIDDFASMAEECLAGLDEPWRSLAGRVSVRIEEFADEETLEALGVEDAFDLTGLYSGVALTLDTPSSPSAEPPVIRLFRSPILAEWIDLQDTDLETLLAHVLIHELAHHFGWSDEDIDRALAED